MSHIYHCLNQPFPVSSSSALIAFSAKALKAIKTLELLAE